MKQAGFTLMELVVALGISVVVGGLLVVIIVNSTGLYYKQSSKLQEGINTNDIQTSIRENIKNSSAIVASFTSSGITYTTNVTQLVLKLPSIDSSNNIISNIFDYYVYYLDTNKLRFKTFPDAQSNRKAQDQIFATSLELLNFEYFDSSNPPQQVAPSSARKVRISLILKQKTGANYETLTATSEANLRND